MQKRKQSQAELKAYVQAAESAYQDAVSHLGSLRPTRRVSHTFTTMTEAFHQVAKMGAEGWTVRNDVISHTLYAIGAEIILDKPESMVEADLATVREQAAKDYVDAIIKHNNAVDRAEQDKQVYEAAKAAWLKEEAEKQAKAEDEAFRAAMAQRGVQVAEQHQLTSEWSA